MKKEIKILTMGDCLYCSKCEKLIKKIKKDFPSFKVKRVNVARNLKMLHRYNLMSIPAIVVNDKLKFCGIPSKRKLKRILEVKK